MDPGPLLQEPALKAEGVTVFKVAVVGEIEGGRGERLGPVLEGRKV